MPNEKLMAEIMDGLDRLAEQMNEESKPQTKGEIELREEWAVIGLPEDAVEVEITAKVYADGKIVEVVKTLDMKEVRKAFQEAADGYIPSDAVFVLADEGRALLKDGDNDG